MILFDRSSLKANPDIFLKVKNIEAGPELVLTPPSLDVLDEDAKCYVVNSNNPDVLKFIPSVYANNIEDAKVMLKGFINNLIFGGCLPYSIRLKNGIPIGYIILYSPLMDSTKSNEWNIDFWMNKSFMNNGIMTYCLHMCVRYLQENEVKVINALVHEQNDKTLQVLGNVGFSQVDKEAGGEKRLVYGIRLN